MIGCVEGTKGTIKEGTQVFALNTWLDGINFTDTRTVEKDPQGRGWDWRAGFGDCWSSLKCSEDVQPEMSSRQLAI